MSRDVHSLMLSQQQFLCRPPMVLERLSWRVICSNHLSFLLLTVARRGSSGAHTKKVDLAPHSVVGLVLQVGDVEKFLQALGLESLDLFLRISEQCPCLKDMDEGGDDKRLVQLNLLANLMVLRVH